MHSISPITESKVIAESLTLAELRDELNKALDQSMAWCMPEDRSREVPNALRSSYFCFMAGKCLPLLTNTGGKLRHIRFNNNDIKRESGEWLLDAVVADCDDDGREGVVTKIRVAMECESSTVLKEFVTDFSKLLHVKSETKIYLQGLNQRRVSSAQSFIDGRLKMAAKYIREIDLTSNWYFGFWPSPLALDIDADDRSLWAELKKGNHSHLRYIRLYKFNGWAFVDED